MTIDRLIALEGAVNFRDLGGYTTVDGQRTRWRVLFRADGLGELTEADLATMRELGIRTVVDLRSGDEVEQSRFDVEAHPVTFHHFPFIKALPKAVQYPSNTAWAQVKTDIQNTIGTAVTGDPSSVLGTLQQTAQKLGS